MFVILLIWQDILKSSGKQYLWYDEKRSKEQYLRDTLKQVPKIRSSQVPKFRELQVLSFKSRELQFRKFQNNWENIIKHHLQKSFLVGKNSLVVYPLLILSAVDWS